MQPRPIAEVHGPSFPSRLIFISLPPSASIPPEAPTIRGTHRTGEIPLCNVFFSVILNALTIRGLIAQNLFDLLSLHGHPPPPACNPARFRHQFTRKNTINQIRLSQTCRTPLPQAL
jgi:hypothetical protein